MVSYSKQVALCESVRETIRQDLGCSDDLSLRQQANRIPHYDSILRAASLAPNVDTEEKLKDFIIEFVLKELHLTAAQKDRLGAAIGPEPLYSNA